MRATQSAAMGLTLVLSAWVGQQASAVVVEDSYAGGVFGTDYAFQATTGIPTTALAAGIAGQSSESPNSALFDATATGGYLTLKANSSPQVGGAVTINATPTVAGNPIIFTDSAVAALINVNNQGSKSDIGLFLRGSGSGASATAYILNFDLDDGTLDLAKATGLTASNLTPGVVFGAGYSAADDFYLEFTAVGSTLTGRLYTDATKSTLLQSLSATDSTLTSGFAGVYASFNNDPIAQGNVLGTFDNLLVASQIPEPASLALLSLGGLAMLRRRKA